MKRLNLSPGIFPIRMIKDVIIRTQFRDRQNSCGNMASSRLLLALPKNLSPQPTVIS